MTVQTLLNLLVKMPGDVIITCVGDIRAIDGDLAGTFYCIPEQAILYIDESFRRCYLSSNHKTENPLQV